MCAKVKMVRTAKATSSDENKTPKRQTGRPSKPPSKTPAKTPNRRGGNASPQRPSTGRRTRASESHDDSQLSPPSDAGSSETSDDFLCNPTVQRVTQSDGSDDSGSQQSEQPSTTQRPSTGGRQQPRKQPKPKKRKNNIGEEIKLYQNTTKLLIPRLPFQR